MADCWQWWMRIFLFMGCLAGLPVSGSAIITPSDAVMQIKFAKMASLWSVRGFLNVESPVDIGLFDHSCQQMEFVVAAADGTFGIAEDDVPHHRLGSEEGVLYRRGQAALV